MKGINQSVLLGLEILTPTQSGSGEELFLESDYIDRGNDAFIVDQARTFNAIASGDASLDQKLAQGNRLSDWVNLAGQDFGYRLSWLAGKHKTPEKFREHVKDAMNRPYIPGTAIKGAIRTACIAEHIRNSKDSFDKLLPYRDSKRKGPSASRTRASSKLMDRLIGHDAKQDLFRVLKVRDAIFNNDDLRLADIRWLNEKRWRSMSKRRSIDEWQKADGLFAEVLRTDALAEFSLQWEDFLLSDSRWQQKDTLPNLLPKNWEELKQILNSHARYRLEHEIEFYRDQDKPQPKLECERVRAMLDDGQAAYLQLSWGSGWRGMTGDWLQDAQLQNIRDLYRLGRQGRPFPKTRRLVVSGEPKLPLGWVKLIPHHLIAEQLEQQRQQQQAQSERCAWVDQQIGRIVLENRCSEQEALRGKGLANAWQQLEDDDLKQAALADIKARWQAEGWWDEPNGKAAKQARKIYGD